MAKGKDVAPMEIDEQNSTDSDQINNPKFSVNGTLSVYVFFFFFPGILCFSQHFAAEFSVLQLLKSAQMQHGLRFGDYARYRYDQLFSHAMFSCYSVSI